MTIPAKRNGFFTLRFEPNRAGDLSGSATIYSNDPQTPVVGIRVSGTGYRPQIRRFFNFCPGLRAILKKNDPPSKSARTKNNGLRPTTDAPSRHNILWMKF